MQVNVIPGVGPATAERLRRIGVRTVAELELISVEELTRVLGAAQGTSLYALARADDDRAVVSDRETKSVSVEDTFDTDLVDQVLLAAIVDRHARSVCERLRKAKLSGRTVTLKVRMHDFATHTRSATLAGPTDRPALVSKVARALLAEVDTSGGVRLLGVGVSGLADWIQDDLFGDEDDTFDEPLAAPPRSRRRGLGTAADGCRGWTSQHTDHGPGWVWGAGLGRVTVRFETAETGPGPIMTFAADDQALSKPSGREPDRRRRTTSRSQPTQREIAPVPRPQLRALPQVGSSTTRDDRIAAGHRMVGQEHQRLTAARDLYGARDDALAWQLSVRRRSSCDPSDAVEPDRRRGSMPEPPCTSYESASRRRRP